MPEGDTIYRSAQRMQQALAGRAVTGLWTDVPGVLRLLPERLVGQTVSRVEARGKHLLHWFTPAEVSLHTHMRMTGSWHIYETGARWRKPRHLARMVLTTGAVEAVAFSVPVMELLSAGQVQRHPVLRSLGPDPLAGGVTGEVDLQEAGRRLAALADQPIGVALLDQRVLAGVGNVYKNEVLFIHAVDPWTRVSEVPEELQAALLRTSAALLKANIAHGGSGRITTRKPALIARAQGRSSTSDAVWVYGKAGRPCPRCATPIRSAALGEHARITYWCPTCQGPGPRLRA